MVNYYESTDRNKLLSSVIFAIFLAFVTGVVWVFARAQGYGLDMIGLFLIMSGLGSFASYYWSDKIVLAISGARPADKHRDREFYAVTENLARAAKLPMPKLYVIDDTAMNAFATGRDPKNGVVVATTGLLARLDRTELEGVVAHELSHIRNYDIRLGAVVSVLVGLIALLADLFLRMSMFGGKRDRESGSLQVVFLVLGFVLALLSPIIAQLIQLAISRRREYYADASAAQITKYPDGLIRALKKLSSDTEPLEAANKATAHMYIVNPLKNHHDAVGMFAGMFSTHPPINERIKVLESMK